MNDYVGQKITPEEIAAAVAGGKCWLAWLDGQPHLYVGGVAPEDEVPADFYTQPTLIQALRVAGGEFNVDKKNERVKF